MYTELGMRRKAAFFLRETAQLHAKIFNHTLSHRLLSLACPYVMSYVMVAWYRADALLMYINPILHAYRSLIPCLFISARRSFLLYSDANPAQALESMAQRERAAHVKQEVHVIATIHAVDIVILLRLLL